MTIQTENPLQSLIDAHTAGKAEPAWLSELRADAADSFAALGVPTVRHEEWRYTSLKSLLALKLAPAAHAAVLDADLKPYFIAGADDIRLVFVNGHFDAALSKLPTLPQGLLVAPLSSQFRTDDEGLPSKLARYADHHAQPFTALNMALFSDGAYIRAGRDAQLETPVHVLYVATAPQATAPRTLLLAGENAGLTLIESFVGLGKAAGFCDAVCEIVLQQGAHVQHTRLLRDGVAHHIGWNEVRQDRDSNYTHNSISLQAQLARNDVNVMLTGEGANCTLHGLVLGAGSAHVDNHIIVDHVRPRCVSKQLYRSVVDERARSVFSGKVIVRPGAAGTDAQQQNNNLLLSDDARADTKPQLEIYCDDVKCSHGATSGQLDAAAVFFLRSRGLDVQQARNVLTYAFANEIIEQVTIEPVRAHLEDVMRQRFHGLLGD
ncbi:MAG: Fe-S cluster assembly protein SufD [Planctomycetes bacterium]|nr:Fe-S cluster assembly protein SufD [Planctomycetota bacterium]MCW8136314.1 Fe-S cluster assembly protein SufD [Planctomycetota bacterium]